MFKTRSRFGVVADPDSEPVFNPAIHTTIWQDGFDGYNTLEDAVAAGWRTGANPDNTQQDISTDPGGSNLIITGRNGIGKALRLRYHGIDNGAGQEGHAWSRDTNDILAGKNSHPIYLSCYLRIRPNGDSGTTFDFDVPEGANRRIIRNKGFMFWNEAQDGRFQFNTQNHNTTNDLPLPGYFGGGTFWRGITSDTVIGGTQVSPPLIHTLANEWPRVTIEYRTQSAGGANDGQARLWYNGNLVCAIGPTYADVDPPNRIVGTQKWCTADDLAAFFVDQYVPRLTFGSVMTATLWPFDWDLDDMNVWRVT